MYSDIELDALKEVGNIGAGNAATALSTILSTKVEMSVPEANIVKFDDVSTYVGGPESIVAGVFLRVSGDIDGNVLLIIPKKDANALTGFLLKNPVSNKKDESFSSLEKSALAELGNIVTSSYIVALSNLTNLSMKLSVPSFAFDMAGAILSTPLSLYGYMGDTAFLINTEFTEGMDGINLHFLLIPDDKSLKILLNSIGVSSIESNYPGRNGRI